MKLKDKIDVPHWLDFQPVRTRYIQAVKQYEKLCGYDIKIPKVRIESQSTTKLGRIYQCIKMLFLGKKLMVLTSKDITTDIRKLNQRYIESNIKGNKQ